MSPERKRGIRTPEANPEHPAASWKHGQSLFDAGGDAADRWTDHAAPCQLSFCLLRNRGSRLLLLLAAALLCGWRASMLTMAALDYSRLRTLACPAMVLAILLLADPGDRGHAQQRQTLALRGRVLYLSAVRTGETGGRDGACLPYCCMAGPVLGCRGAGYPLPFCDADPPECQCCHRSSPRHGHFTALFQLWENSLIPAAFGNGGRPPGFRTNPTIPESRTASQYISQVSAQVIC